MSSQTSESRTTRAAQERDRLKRKVKDSSSFSLLTQLPAAQANRRRTASSRLDSPLKIYLLAYNVLSAFLWLNLLLRTLHTIFTPHPTTPLKRANSILSRYLPSPTPAPVKLVLDRLRDGYDHADLGWWTKYTQLLAVLEVVHSALGWVRSPVATSIMQVASRLWTVWGVVEAAPSTHSNPLFTVMLLAWSVTEVIRYSSYALAVLGISVGWLDYLRYTTFIPLYPLGASSEAFLSLSTLPPITSLPYFPSYSILSHLPPSLGKNLSRTWFGRGILWRAAQAGVKRKVGAAGSWGVMKVARLVLFLVWWPALYVLYSHMFRQRRRVLGGGRKVGVKSKVM